MGNKALTWQQILAVFSGIFVIIGLGITFGADIPDKGRPIGAWILALSIPTLLGSIAHHATSYWRSDLEPDLLAKMFDPRRIYQVGDAHFWLEIHFIQDYLLISLVAQNIRDADGDFLLNLEVTEGQGILMMQQFSFGMHLGASELVAFVAPLPLGMRPQAQKIRFQLRGRCRIGGTKVRFARRVAVTQPVSPALTVLALLGGHIVHGGGTFVEMLVPAGMPAAPADESARALEQQTIWSKGDSADPEWMVGSVREFMVQKIRKLNLAEDQTSAPQG